MKRIKKTAFLIYIANKAEFEQFLHITDHNGLVWLNFISKRDTLRSKYVIVDLVSRKAMWGGNDLRPFGFYTPKYCSINDGAMSMDSFVKIFKLLEESKITGKEYVVPATNKVLRAISRDRYTILHRPYFAMKDCTHNLYTIRPISQCGVDAAKTDSESMTEEEFLELYSGAKAGVDDFIRDNFTQHQAPIDGFTLITNDGKFISLAEKGFDYDSFVDELERQNYDVDVDRRRIPFLEEEGYIYCDTHLYNGSPYYPCFNFFKLPTPQQFDALKAWLEHLGKKAKLEVMYDSCFEKRFWLDRNSPEKIFEYINSRVDFHNAATANCYKKPD